MVGETPPDAELEVLGILSRLGEATAAQLREELAMTRPLTHSAVNTLLTRLMDKALVSRRKGPVGKAFLYRAVRKGKRAGSRALRDLARRLFDGDPAAVVASLYETRRPTKDEIDQLERLLDALRDQAREKQQ
jgi:predicted transcriptional regulator